MLHKRSSYLTLCFALASIVTFWSCGTGDSSFRVPTQTITLAKTMSPINLLLEVAETQHMWAQEAITIRDQVFPSARQAMDAIVTNSSDMATVADTPLLIAEHRHPNLKLLCTLTASDYHLALVVRWSQIKPTCAGLKNKRIALAIGTTQQYFLDHYLNRDAAGCGIAVVNLTPVDALTAFAEGTALDGLIAWEPQLSKALWRPGAVLVTADPFPEVFGLAYGPKSKLMDAGLRARARRVLAHASQWVELHPVETRNLLASSQQLPADSAEALRQRYSFSIDREDQMISGMAQQEQWAKEKGYIDSIFGTNELRRILGR